MVWLLVGLVSGEALTAALAALRSLNAVPLSLLAELVWWAVIAVVFTGGAAMLTAPDGARVDRYGIPNGLTAIRAWAVVPLIELALYPLPGRTSLVLWVGVGGVAGLLDAVDGFVARRTARR